MNKEDFKKKIEKTIDIVVVDYSDEPKVVVKQLSREAINGFKSQYGENPINYERHSFKSEGITLIVNVAENKCKIEYMDCCYDSISDWFDIIKFEEQLRIISTHELE